MRVSEIQFRYHFSARHVTLSSGTFASFRNSTARPSAHGAEAETGSVRFTRDGRALHDTFHDRWYNGRVVFTGDHAAKFQAIVGDQPPTASQFQTIEGTTRLTWSE